MLVRKADLFAGQCLLDFAHLKRLTRHGNNVFFSLILCLSLSVDACAENNMTSIYSPCLQLDSS